MKFLVIGSKGQLGKEFLNKFDDLGFQYIGVDITDLDVTNYFEVVSIIKKHSPDIVINCSAYNLVDKAEDDFSEVYKVNSIGPYNLALACRKNNILLIHYSSDYVFDGIKGSNYTEGDEPNPLNEYGKSKLLGEKLIQQVTDNYLIFRLSWLYGDGSQNFMYKLKNWFANNDTVKVSDDEISIPTSVNTVVDVTMQAITNKISGLYHLTNSGYCSRYEWAIFVKDFFKIDKKLVPAKMDDFGLSAKRPIFSVMSNEMISKKLGINIKKWDDEVTDFLSK